MRVIPQVASHSPASTTLPPDVLGADQLRALLRACEGRGFEDRRDAALIRFMLATGLRVSETCDLEVGDVDLSLRLATVRSGKGDKARIVRFDAATAKHIDRYLPARARHRHGRRRDLWIGFRGPLTRKGVPAILDKRTAMVGIGHVHAHQLRHTWAHRWLTNGGAEQDMMRLGGWSDHEVMSRYASAGSAYLPVRLALECCVGHAVRRGGASSVVAGGGVRWCGYRHSKHRLCWL
jgi:site-specific recombinase XerD